MYINIYMLCLYIYIYIYIDRYMYKGFSGGYAGDARPRREKEKEGAS